MQGIGGNFALNDSPLDMEDIGVVPPNYFSNLLGEAIGESPLPAITTPIHDVCVQAAATTTGTGGSMGATNTTSVADGINDDEASSQPNAPYVGMRFDTMLEAKAHYNAYAAVKGFSIKQNTSRRCAYTGLLDKQQFACNKFRKPGDDDGMPDKQAAVGAIPDPEPVDEIDEEAAEIASVIADIAAQGPKQKKQKARKRETIIKTYCKAKMVVKLKDGRWEVIRFVEEHNHPLVTKPSLTKYLRSHQGIPAEEKEFVKNLHNTNLPAGMGIVMC